MGEMAEWSALLLEEERVRARARARAEASPSARAHTQSPTGVLLSPSPAGVASQQRRSPRLAEREQSSQEAAAERDSAAENAPAGKRARTGGKQSALFMNFFGRATVNVQPSSGAAGEDAPAAAPAVAVAVPLAQHERERILQQKKSAGPRGRAHAVRITPQAKGVSIEERLKTFPNQALKASAGQLWCSACALTLPNISSSIKDHISTNKHRGNLRKLEEKEAAGKLLHTDLVDYFAVAQDEQMSTVRTDVHVFRYRVAEAFLLAGTPFSRMVHFRPLLEEGRSTSLTTPAHMASYIPKIEGREFAKVRGEAQGQLIGVQFDGTSRLGEACNLVARWCSDDFTITTRLVRFITTKLHMSGAQLASMITRILCTDVGMDPERVICMGRDSASVNGAACRLLSENPFTIAESVLCIAHTCNNAGERIELDILAEFTTPWLELVGGTRPHPGARALWRSTVAPTKVPGFSNVRWYSKAEIQFVLAQHYDKLSPFLQELARLNYGESTRAKMIAIVDSTTKGKLLRLQLAAMLDMMPLVRTTYELEGDRLEILLVYDRIEKLLALGRAIERGDDGAMPNLDAALRAGVKLQKGVAIYKAFPGLSGTFKATIVEGPFVVESELYPGEERPAYKVKYPSDGFLEDLEEEELRKLLPVKHMPERKGILEGLVPAFQYLDARVSGTCEQQYSCAHMYEVCRVAQAFNPIFAAQHLTPDFVDGLSIIKPLLAHVSLLDMKRELPAYLATAASLSPSAFDVTDVGAFSDAVLGFWRGCADSDLKAWKLAARLVFAISPNSAACERVFSLLNNMFGDSQDNSLADYLQAALLLAYNGRQPS